MLVETENHILLLYLNTGGGHSSAARALQAEIERMSPGSCCIPADGIGGPMTLLRSVVEGGYRFAGIQFPWVWPGIYEVSRLRFIQDLYFRAMYFLSRAHLRDLIVRHKITRIVVFHYLLIRPLRRVLRSMGSTIPVVVVATDPFTAHPLWFTGHSFPTIVFSERARSCATRRRLLPGELVSVFPPILHPKFDLCCAEPSKRLIKRRLGFDEDRPVVLVAAGGDGLPRGGRILEALLRAKPDAQYVVVCGRNPSLLKQASAIVRRHPERSVRVFGFVDFIYELMCVAEVVVTKGGPAMIFEALILGKPLIISSYVYGQERGNVDFVVKNRLGRYVEKPAQVAELVNRILKTGRDEVTAAGSLPIYNGTAGIARFILGCDGNQAPPALLRASRTPEDQNLYRSANAK